MEHLSDVETINRVHAIVNPEGTSYSYSNIDRVLASMTLQRGAAKAVSVPPRDTFMERLEAFHRSGAGGGIPLNIPVFCFVPLDLHKVFTEVQSRGGYTVGAFTRPLSR